ncbi:MAG TPA: amidophosphoribosyltransferase, partial [Candidatus Nanoarchaeia archaeon]|nr:amidophosphoribosyltransferase [Candidatus Nanoarchaeia archaeon]
VHMLHGAGARSVSVLISSPPVKYPDFYGIDTPKQVDLIAANLSVKKIASEIGCDYLGYLSQKGMLKATGLTPTKLSTSCFDGVYPIDILERATEVVAL